MQSDTPLPLLQRPEMPALVYAKDWSATPLGARETWSASLKLALDIILSSGFPMALRWGPEFVLIYNDGYKPILGDKHPWALGLPAREAWSEVWPTIAPIHEAILSGRSAPMFSEDLLLRIRRHGDLWEDAHFALGYSAVPDKTCATGVGGVLVSAVETTQRLRMEEQLRQAQAALLQTNATLEAERGFLSRLFENAPSFMAVLRGPNHRFQLANRAYLQLVGERAVIDQDAAEVLPEFRDQGFIPLLDEVLASARPYIGRRIPADLERGPDGEPERRYVDMVLQPIPGENGTVDGVFINGSDITDRVVAEEALHRLNSDLEREIDIRTRDRDRVWRLSRDLMLVARYDATIEAVNPAWTSLLGRAPEELIGKSFLRFVHPEDRAITAAEAEKLSAGSTTLRFDNRYLHADGSFRHISWTAVPEDGLLHGVGRDVTAQKQSEAALRASEAALRQAQKMEAIGQLTGGIAHDFNNMLAIVLGSLDMIDRRLARADYQVGPMVANAREGAERAAALTSRLLAFSRQSPLAPQTVDLNRLISGMSDLLRRTLGERIALEVVCAGGLWPTHADPNQLESAVLNLAINARDAMSDGGRLTIETANTHLDDQYSSLETGVASGQYVMISVTDTGIGMSPEAIARAFDPFFTTKPAGKGTGLGLSMVYGFVKQSGGHAKIYSELGRGTSAKIYLPRHSGKANSDESRPAPEHYQLGTHAECILVVEDDDHVRRMSVDALRELGYTVFAAANGAQALQMFDGIDRVDLLFTDVVMPGMTGRQLADALRLRKSDLRVLFTTGYTRNAIVHNGVLDAGASLLSKPFTLQQLSAKLRLLLDG